MNSSNTHVQTCLFHIKSTNIMAKSQLHFDWKIKIIKFLTINATVRIFYLIACLIFQKMISPIWAFSLSSFSYNISKYIHSNNWFLSISSDPNKSDSQDLRLIFFLSLKYWKKMFTFNQFFYFSFIWASVLEGSVIVKSRCWIYEAR